ncbi:MAG: c-type cytochrome [Pseudomonadota bacterium]
MRMLKASLGLAAMAGLAAAGLTTLAVRAAPISYELPGETAEFRPGPGVEVAQANCAACHSADYVNTQPRGAGFGREFWQAEVTKMIKVFGAPIGEEDAKKIVDYLASTY